MPTVITVENLGKKYLLSHQAKQGSYVALRDVVSDGVRSLGRKMLHPFRSSPFTPHSSLEEFWALKGVSFEVKQGDRVGIIGRNGAGKSTLLKILSRITEPTSGSVRLRGRVASLLEVGTGFHPELTGRENIFLNGAILGMSRAEIRKKFDEIVDFAEIEKFIDTPVKRYSSGMYLRLAFAVAAHLDPEILIVDEVLAVGDAPFQRKCIGKMQEVSASDGRTILFVSHNLSAIHSLCTRCIALKHGEIAANGVPGEVTKFYLEESKRSLEKCENKTGNRFAEVFIASAEGEPKKTLFDGERAYLILRLYVEINKGANCGFTIFNGIDLPLLSSCALDSFSEMPRGLVEYKVELPLSFLPTGKYRIEGAIWGDQHVYEKNECLTEFNLVRGDATLEINGAGSRGYLVLPNKWTVGKA